LKGLSAVLKALHLTQFNLFCFVLEQSLESLNAELAMLTSDIDEVEIQLQKHRESGEEGIVKQFNSNMNLNSSNSCSRLF
jgi:2-iminoacetate synthase ThiH